MRAFIGLPASSEVRSRWAALLPRLKALGVKASWVAPENLHLTMKFLGDVQDARIAEIRAAMDASFAGMNPVVLDCQGIGFFPDERRPRVLYVRYSKDAGLLSCQSDLEERLEALEFPREYRPFEVHLTLARLKYSWPPPAIRRAVDLLSKEPWPGLPAISAVLYESTLTPQGPIYSPVYSVGAKA
jgi:2'-5' RNA ligase